MMERLVIFCRSISIKYIVLNVKSQRLDKTNGQRGPIVDILFFSLMTGIPYLILGSFIKEKDISYWFIIPAFSLFSFGLSYMVWLLTTSAELSGKINGAIHALNHPPSTGKTHIEVTNDFGLKIWESDTIVYDPDDEHDKEGNPLTLDAISTHGNYLITKIELVELYNDYLELDNRSEASKYQKLAEDYGRSAKTIQRRIKQLKAIYKRDTKGHKLE